MIQLLTNLRVILFFAVVALLVGCGDSGGGGKSQDPGSSNWDTMTWDQDNWS